MCNVGRYRDLSDVGQSGREVGKITMNKKEVVDREDVAGRRKRWFLATYLSAIFLLGQTCRTWQRYNVHIGLMCFVKLARVTIIASTDRGCRYDRHYHHCHCGGTVIFARWFPVVLRVCFRISLDRNSGLRRLRTARKFTKTPLATISVTHDRPSSCRPLSPSDLCRSIRRLTKQVVTSLRERLTRTYRYLLATRKRGDVYLAGVVAIVKKFDSRFSLIPHPTSHRI